MRKRRFSLAVAVLAVLAAFALSLLPLPAGAVDDDDQFIPTGVHITPSAAPGSIFQPLNPGLSFDPTFTVGQAVTTALSPNGRTLLILTSGYNSQNFTSGSNEGSPNPAESNEYVFVYDVSGHKPLLQQVLQVPNAFDGLAWNPGGAEFYLAGGPDDNVHVFVKGTTNYAEDDRLSESVVAWAGRSWPRGNCRRKAVGDCQLRERLDSSGGRRFADGDEYS